MQKLLFIYCVIFFVSPVQAQNSLVTATGLKSPNGNIALSLSIQNSHLYYTVSYHNQPVIETSLLAIAINGVPTTSVNSFGAIQKSSKDTVYSTRGVHSLATDHHNEALFTINSTGGTSFILDAKLFNDGLAFRYIVPATDSNTVNADSTTFTIPAGSIGWSQGDADSYEGTYQQQDIESINKGGKIGPPFTIKLPGNAGYMAITESGVTNFSGMCLKAAGNRAFKTILKGPSRIFGNIETPWRVIEIGKDLNTLVNCDIIANVSPEADASLFPQGYETPWIAPGKSVWSWIAQNSPLPQADVTYANMLHYSKLASETGIENNLLDQGWETNFPTGNLTQWDILKQLIDSAKAENVNTWVWKPYSKVGPFFPDPGIKDSVLRRTFFTQCAEAGVTGIKIDFFPGETQEAMAYYQAALKDAAQLHLMLDFHGTDKPTGQSRTWPNEMAREGIRGLEHSGTSTSWPSHNTTLPFTRFLAGHGDYTPFSLRQDVIGGTTLTHQLATLVIFTSPFMCLAVNPDSLLVSPVKDIIAALPTTWDETIVLPQSEIGQVAVFARRKGEDWYVAAINGSTQRTLQFKLPAMNYDDYSITMFADDTVSPAKTIITHPGNIKAGLINIMLQPGGGTVIKLQKITDKKTVPIAKR